MTCEIVSDKHGGKLFNFVVACVHKGAAQLTDAQQQHTVDTKRSTPHQTVPSIRTLDMNIRASFPAAKVAMFLLNIF